MVVDRLALVDIRDVQLDLRPLEHFERVEDRDRGEAVAGRIDDDPGRLDPGRVDGLDDLALEIRLAELDGKAELGRIGLAPAADLVQRRMPVDLGLALPQQIEVRPVQMKIVRIPVLRDSGDAGAAARTAAPMPVLAYRS